MLVYQQRDLVPIGEFGILCHRHSAVMVVIAQRHVDGRDGAQLFEKAEEMGQAFGYVEEISGDENPIRVESPHGFDNTIMPWMTPVKVQIREMDGTTTSQSRMCASEHGDLVIGQTEFPMGHETEHSIERFAQTTADE